MVNVVFYDLETTGLHAGCEVIQIGASWRGLPFMRYMMPQYQIDPKASAVNRLDVRSGQLCRNGYVVNTTPTVIAWTDFLNFLNQCGGNVVLVAHNGHSFDHGVLMRTVTSLGLRHMLLAAAPFAGDTKYHFPQEDRNSRLQDIAAKYGVWSGNAHDAQGDADMIQQLCYVLSIYDAQLAGNAVPMQNYG